MRSTPSALIAALAAFAMPGAAAAAPSPRAPAIAVEALPELDAWAVTGLPPNAAALPRGLWSGSDAAQLAAAFDAVPAEIYSPTAAALAQRALLSSGAVPPGESQVALRKRFEALGRLGAAAPLAAMTEGGAAARDPIVQQYGAQAALALGRFDQACARARAISGDPGGFVLRLRATCFALDGEWPSAELTLDLARRAGAADPWLSAALPALAGVEQARKPEGRYDTSLNAAVSLRLRATPAQDALRRASALAAYAIAVSPDAPIGLRPVAAARALTAGALSADAARAAIAASMPPPDVRRAPRPGPLTRAVAQVAAAGSDAEKAEAIGAVLADTQTGWRFLYTAEIFRNEIKTLPRGAAPGRALVLAIAAAALDEPQAALGWRAVVPADADPATLAALDLTIAFLRADRAGLSAAAEAMIGLERPTPSASRDLALLLNAGLARTPALEAFIAETRPSPGVRALSADVAESLRAAAARKAIGEIALRVAAATAAGPQTLPLADLALALEALETAGLRAERRALLREVLVMGVPR